MKTPPTAGNRPGRPGADHGSRLWPALLIGAVAGAAGTTTLNVITYLDIAVRGRSTSSTPERTVEAMARLLHLTVPGSGDVLANRISGLGALTGYAAGIGMGLILGLAYALGSRPGLLVATLVATVLALVGTNGPMTVLGVTDPRTWGLAGWISDLVPHFGYGVVTALVLHYFYRPGDFYQPTQPDQVEPAP
jgi:hypothetical protein